MTRPWEFRRVASWRCADLAFPCSADVPGSGVERFCGRGLDLADRTFEASLEQHITGDQVCVGTPTVS